MKRCQRRIAETYRIPIIAEIPHTTLVCIPDWALDAIVWVSSRDLEMVDTLNLFAAGEDWRALAATWQLGADKPSKCITDTICCPACNDHAGTVYLETVMCRYMLGTVGGEMKILSNTRQSQYGHDDGSFLCEGCGTQWDTPDKLELYFTDEER